MRERKEKGMKTMKDTINQNLVAKQPASGKHRQEWERSN